MSSAGPHDELIVIDSGIPLLANWLRALQSADTRFVIRELPALEITPATVRDATALVVRTSVCVDAQLLRAAKLELVVSASAGKDHVDEAECSHRGVRFEHAPGCNADAVVDWVIAALFLAQGRGHVRCGRRFGIVGRGQVGWRLDARLRGLGWTTMCCDPPLASAGEADEELYSLPELLAQCDVLSLHLPQIGTGPWPTQPLLRGAVLSEFLAEDRLLINASRGGVLALEDDWGAGPPLGPGRAILDVWPHEPEIPADWLADRGRILLASPHVAGYSQRGKWNASYMALEAILRHFRMRKSGSNLELPEHVYRFEPDTQHGPGPGRRRVCLRELASPVDIVADVMAQCASNTRDDLALRSLAAQGDGIGAGFRRLRDAYALRAEFSDLELELALPAGHTVEAATLDQAGVLLRGCGFARVTWS